jgi:hypothetical protein
MSKVTKTPTGPFNPFYGCTVLLIMVLTIAGIITWTFYSLLKQDQEISTFSTEAPVSFPALTISEADRASLKSKLATFGDLAAKGNSLTLSIADLNNLLVIAAEQHLGEEKGGTPYLEMLRFTRFDPASKSVMADLHLPMNKLPWAGGGKRHIVGTAIFKPVVEANSFDLKLDDIKVPGKLVNEGFLNNIRIMPWLSVAKLKPEIAAPLGKVTSFEISADGSTITLKTGSGSAADLGDKKK